MLLVLCWLLSFNQDRTSFYHKEEKCSFTYSTISEYHLTIDNSKKFELNIQISNTNIMTTYRSSIYGSLKTLGDTLVLSVQNKGNSLINFPGEVKYLMLHESLQKIGTDLLFPMELTRTSMHKLPPTFIKTTEGKLSKKLRSQE